MSSTLEDQQRLIMKPAGLKRALLVLLLMCGVLIFYLFWNQEPPSTPVEIPRSEIIVPRNVLSSQRIQVVAYNPSDPIWTWECTNQKCERHLLDEKKKPTSMTTCNMLCGSTQLWPQPTGPVSLGSKALTFFYNKIVFGTKLQGPVQKLLEQTYASFNETIFGMTNQLVDTSKQTSEIGILLIKVNIRQVDHVKINIHTDESYNLTLRQNNTLLTATINAKTFFGARHGFETLSQLIWWDEFASNGMLKILNAALVQDAPMFPYRGIMLDTSRQFFPVSYIKKVLEGMSANKLNAFHWHITDSQSFPFKAPSAPQFAQYGAYAPDMIYDSEDVRSVVEYAAVRGIRVVMEIDVPAHAGNGWTWGPQQGLGELAVCVNKQPWSMYCGEPPCGQVNPQNPNVYSLLEKLYKDMLQLTDQSEFFHIGGDEVNLECWSQYLNWGGAYANYSDLHDFWGDFTLKALQSLTKANGGKDPSHVVIWSSNLSKRPYVSKYLDKNKIVVQTWGPSQWPETSDLLADGYRIIISHVDAWYLDCGFGRWRENGEAACDPYRPWQSVYNYRPWQHLSGDKKLILGGEACLWTEQVAPESLDSRLWPRAAAFAERLWSDPHTDSYSSNIGEDVYTRLVTQRDRMAKRGFNAEAMWPRWCIQNPGMCL